MKIGIIGGGQLALMMAQEIKRKKLDYEIIVLDPTLNCPASSEVSKQLLGDYNDETKIHELSNLVDIITYEIELANAQVLQKIEKKGKIIAPSPQALFTIQDKLRQKTFLREKQIPVPDFISIASKEDLINALDEFGYPALLKATQGGYDGKGNFVLSSPQDVEKGLELFKGRSLMLEKFINFTKEISIIACRNSKGEIKTYDVGENEHKHNILYTTTVPANISQEVSKKAKELAQKVMESFQGAGVFGIEMFVTSDNEVLINEIAPRVHNSGHHTIEACTTSQFEQHIRAITGMNLGETTLKNSVIMCNILGQSDYTGEYEVIGEDKLPSNAFLHMYNKHETKPQRKIGHITILNTTLQEAQIIKKSISIVPKNE